MMGRVSLIIFIASGFLLYLGITQTHKLMMVIGVAGLFIGLIGMAYRIKNHPATGWMSRL